MDLFLKDRAVLVAGSSRGIGQAIARAFLNEGARVAITGRNAGDLAHTAAGFEAEFGSERLLAYPGDLSQPEPVSELLGQIQARWGQLDCLVANIGSGSAKPGWQLSPQDWETAFQVNFWTSVRVAEAVLPGMVAAGRGNIIFISSITGLESLNAPLPYSAAKSALVNYSHNLARQVGQNGVRINCVAPGNILFPGGSWEKKLTQDRERFMSYIRAEVPLQRFGAPEEIADLVVFLASDRAAFITGACIVADGGQVRGI